MLGYKPTIRIDSRKGSTLIVSSLALKHSTRVEVDAVANALAYYNDTITAVKSCLQYRSLKTIWYTLPMWMFIAGNTKGEVSLYHWPPVWLFVISCMASDNFCCYFQNRLIKTSQTGGQWYSDTPPLVFPVHWQANLTGRNLGRVFNSRRGRTRLYYVIKLITKTSQLKVEESAQTTLSFCVTMCLYLKLSEVNYLDLKWGSCWIIHKREIFWKKRERIFPPEVFAANAKAWYNTPNFFSLVIFFCLESGRLCKNRLIPLRNPIFGENWHFSNTRADINKPFYYKCPAL